MGDISHPTLVAESTDQVPLYVLTKDFYIPPFSKPVVLTDAEYKQVSMQANKDRFLVYTVSLLTRSCRFVKT
jgi:hypothetical protein